MKLTLAATLLAAGAALSGCANPNMMAAQPMVQPVIAAPPRQVCDTRFTVVNRSNTTVRELYFSSSALSSFGVDQLGQRVLQPGQAMNFAAANPGNYDFRAIWVNGRRADLMRVNICAASRITVTNGGLIAQ